MRRPACGRRRTVEGLQGDRLGEGALDDHQREHGRRRPWVADVAERYASHASVVVDDALDGGQRGRSKRSRMASSIRPTPATTPTCALRQPPREQLEDRAARSVAFPRAAGKHGPAVVVGEQGLKFDDPMREFAKHEDPERMQQDSARARTAPAAPTSQVRKPGRRQNPEGPPRYTAAITPHVSRFAGAAHRCPGHDGEMGCQESSRFPRRAQRALVSGPGDRSPSNSPGGAPDRSHPSGSGAPARPWPSPTTSPTHSDAGRRPSR